MSRTATPADVIAGSARWCVVEGDALDVVTALPVACLDAVVTDPPSGIAFMGAEWDRDKGGRAQWVAWLAEVLGHARAATRDGGRALVWSLPRTSHWTGCAVEDAGWSIETTVTHLFGCLTPDTEILVNGEWVSYDKATAGNLALCYDAGRDSLAWQPISELVVYDHHQHLYRLAGERTDQLVTRGHRCPVYRDGRIVFLSADEVAEGGTAEVPVVEDVQGMLAAIPVPQRPRGPFEGVRGRVPGDAATGEAEDGAPGLRDVRVGVHAEGQQAARLVPVLLGGMLREVACGEPGDHRAHARGGPQGQSGLDGRVEGVVPHEDDRAGQSGVEGRRHAGEFQGELSARRVRALSAGVLCDGAAGRLDSGTQVDGGAGHRSHAHDSGERASRQPRPAGQSSGEPDAVREQLGSQAVRASRFAAPDLVRVEPARHDGVVWCVRVPTGAFVARRNGKVFITGNTGWPKGKSQLKPLAETWWLARTGRSTALNIDECRVGGGPSPSIDRRASAADRGIGPAGARPGGIVDRSSLAAYTASREGEAAGRYPPNVVLSHAPGCRCVGERRVRGSNDGAGPSNSGIGYGSGAEGAATRGYADPDGTETVEAWECVEGCPVAELDAQAGDRPGLRAGTMLRRGAASGAGLGYGSTSTTQTVTAGHDEGGEVNAARFFPQFPADEYALFGYHAKPSRAERDAGVSLDARPADAYAAHRHRRMEGEPERFDGAPVGRSANDHPTVKSISLMRWLIRLVTKPGDVVLDPFGGSGTTGVAALAEGRRVILVERDPRFAEIARQRIEHVTPDIGRPVRVAPSASAELGADSRQLALFGSKP